MKGLLLPQKCCPCYILWREHSLPPPVWFMLIHLILVSVNFFLIDFWGWLDLHNPMCKIAHHTSLKIWNCTLFFSFDFSKIKIIFLFIFLNEWLYNVSSATAWAVPLHFCFFLPVFLSPLLSPSSLSSFHPFLPPFFLSLFPYFFACLLSSFFTFLLAILCNYPQHQEHYKQVHILTYTHYIKKPMTLESL